jgi:hypothetical protein
MYVKVNSAMGIVHVAQEKSLTLQFPLHYVPLNQFVYLGPIYFPQTRHNYDACPLHIH